ncbi:asparagine synthetase domain-containing protein 1-like isoform X1 [Dinothrombium tinctorium]|uniref:Asparagine synthetase domain-containing protein 1-like isoform X1 n=1 Tax=Dinothrombium tinctorium TaxID=1965070 RepID=A0A443RKA2_9ACAR|nr:asparagine synthetase domain-containing protein 1-like isoform X1 [Dinothrombium tinctorium]
MNAKSGDCYSMCPSKEIEWRSKAGLLHKFEMLEGTENDCRPKADLNKVVKQFVRTSVGQKEVDYSTLRPAPVLMETVRYLLTEVVSINNCPWNVVYDYVFDRLRAVRQDMVIQGITGNPKIYILENCVLFHLYASYTLCEEELRLFDPFLNNQHLQECLEILLVQYDETVKPTTRRRHIFESIYILFNLDSLKVLNRFGHLPRNFKENNIIKKCYKISIWFANASYCRILQEVCRLPNILRYAINRHINTIHFRYLRIMSYAYHSVNCRIPVGIISKWLCPFESETLALRVLRTLCRDYGIKIVDKSFVQFDKNGMKKEEKLEVGSQELEKSVYFLHRRGPDFEQNVSRNFKSENGQLFLTLYSSVLHVRGNDLIKQPFEDEFGNVLLWNGEVFDGLESLRQESNDTQILAQKLSSCSTEAQILDCFSKLRGPYSFVYLQNNLRRLWFGRDIFGRRSLCFKHTSKRFLLASVIGFAEDPNEWQEVPCSGIYNIVLSEKFDFNPILYKWNRSVTGLHLVESNELCLQSPIHTLLNTNTVDLELTSESDHVIDQFLSVLDNAVRVRVELQNSTCKNCLKPCDHSILAVLFSGGLDSTVLAALADNHLPFNIPIDLINVAFDKRAADRLTAISALNELREMRPNRLWNFVSVDVSLQKLRKHRNKQIRYLIHPLKTVLDDSIGCSLWFAARGKGLLNNELYTSPAKIMLLGIGADEQLGGYTRHRRIFDNQGLKGLLGEISLDLNRISSRNLGRDDRIASDSGREARFPFLDETVVNYLNSLPVLKKCNLDKQRGHGEKLLLRLAARKLGFVNVCKHHKRAIQFGTGIAKLENRKEKADNVCDRLSVDN